jgi:hypothetical protein
VETVGMSWLRTTASALTVAGRFIRQLKYPHLKPMSPYLPRPRRRELRRPLLRRSKPKHLLLKVVEGLGRYSWDVLVSSWSQYSWAPWSRH